MEKLDTKGKKKQGGVGFKFEAPIESVNEPSSDGHFKKVKKIGKASSNRVEIWTAKNEDSGEMCALKVVPKSMIASGEVAKELIFGELKVLEDLHHPNIVRVMEVINNEESIQLAVEYVAGGNLMQRIENSVLSDSQGA